MALILSVLAIAVVLLGSEIWWRKHSAKGELSRKFVHITVGSFVAFWPLFLSWSQIEILSILFLIAVSISKIFGIFKAIHSVQRPTWGELFFALAVGTIALITHDQWIYVAALLQMSLADGLAAVVGSRFGGKYRYSVFGHPKSLTGTLVFFVISIVILLAVNPHLGTPASLGLLVGLAALTSAIENFGVMGSDNLAVPLVVALVLLQA